MKRQVKKLSLTRETIRVLDDRSMGRVNGGDWSRNRSSGYSLFSIEISNAGTLVRNCDFDPALAKRACA